MGKKMQMKFVVYINVIFKTVHQTTSAVYLFQYIKSLSLWSIVLILIVEDKTIHTIMIDRQFDFSLKKKMYTILNIFLAKCP